MVKIINIVILRHTDSVKLYVDDVEVPISSLLTNTKFVYSSTVDKNNLLIKKESRLSGEKWKRNGFLEFISFLLGVSSITLRDAAIEAYQSSIGFLIDISEVEEATLKLTLTKEGFSIVEGVELCTNIVKNTNFDKSVNRRVKLIYYVPIFIILSIITAFPLIVGIDSLLYGNYAIGYASLLVLLLLVVFLIYVFKKYK